MVSTDYFEEINNLINTILVKHISVDKVRKEINRLTVKYGNDIFPEISFERKNRPWDEKYMAELKCMNITGACSKEFILHMAEVSNYIARRKRKKMIIGLIVAVVVMICALIIII